MLSGNLHNSDQTYSDVEYILLTFCSVIILPHPKIEECTRSFIFSLKPRNYTFDPWWYK